jgi:hypothetical protein
VPQNLSGKKVTIKPMFDLGPLSPDGKPLEGTPIESEL